MKVKIRTAAFRLSLALPAAMLRFAIRWIPDKSIEKIRRNMPEPYNGLVTKENIRSIAGDCLDIGKENKGLEIVRVETADGTFVSVKA